MRGAVLGPPCPAVDIRQGGQDVSFTRDVAGLPGQGQPARTLLARFGELAGAGQCCCPGIAECPDRAPGNTRRVDLPGLLQPAEAAFAAARATTSTATPPRPVTASSSPAPSPPPRRPANQSP